MSLCIRGTIYLDRCGWGQGIASPRWGSPLAIPWPSQICGASSDVEQYKEKNKGALFHKAKCQKPLVYVSLYLQLSFLSFEELSFASLCTAQVHFSWLFLPWHRWYLYFHERILGHLIGDPHFSLVFWNWDNQKADGGNMMPTMFTQEGSPLYDAKRNQNHLPPILNTLNITDLTNTSISNDQIIQDNLSIMYNNIVTASTPDLFMGKQYRYLFFLHNIRFCLFQQSGSNVLPCKH